MREEFEKLVASGKITRQNLEPLLQLAQGGFCSHRSWGVGRITTVDTVFCRFTIDFPSKSGHQMDLTFAAQSLKPIPSEHILARKITDLQTLRQMAALHHLDLIKLVLQSFGGKATVDQIQQVLVPDVITEDWKKWWETAKAEIKKDGHFLLPNKKSDPITYVAEEVPMQERLLAEFRPAKGLKAKVAIASQALKSLEDFHDIKGTASELIAGLNNDIASHQRTQPALALEAIFIRNDLRQAADLPSPDEEISEKNIWAQAPRPSSILEDFPAAKHKRALLSFKEAYPENWHDTLTGILNSVSTKLCGECAELLIEEGKLDKLKDYLARLISQHQASSDLLLWLAKVRSDTFADILGPEVFRAMLTAMERDQFNEKKTNRLRDYIVDDQNLLVELIGSADLDVIKDLTRALQLSPCFDDMDKRSLLARIVKSYPAVQSLISGDHSRQDQSFIVSWESLERRKKEYEELVKKKIPANSKEIAIARSYGDLRENHEYKAAKEMQKLLMRRKSELENQLVKARGTDFAGPRPDAVGIGARVQLTELNSQHRETYTILGAWDGDPEKGIISYLTPFAQTLMNTKVGDEIDFEMEGQQKRYRIESIEHWQQPSSTPDPAPDLQGHAQLSTPDAARSNPPSPPGQ
jgi:transcription elongation GreA/GreB family factor